MAFSSTLVKKEQLDGGEIREEWSWNGAGVTTGTITADTTTTPKMVKIKDWSVDNNNNNNTAINTGDKTIQLTFTANDTGRVIIRGSAA